MTKKTLRSGTLNDHRIDPTTGDFYTPEGIPLTSGRVTSGGTTSGGGTFSGAASGDLASGGTAPIPAGYPAVIHITGEGKKGDPGKSGTNGKSILNGPNDPTWENDGTFGDFWINTVSLMIFGPKTQEGWGAGRDIRGPQGDIGPRGPQGRTILHGSVEPDFAIGDVGDFYINTTTPQIWGPKQTNSWGVATSLVGAVSSSEDVALLMMAMATSLIQTQSIIVDRLD